MAWVRQRLSGQRARMLSIWQVTEQRVIMAFLGHIHVFYLIAFVPSACG